MVPFVKWLYLLALSVWLGSAVFFTAAVAPAISRTLESDRSQRVQRAIFPRYYWVGLLCALLGVICVGWLLADRVFGKWPGILSLLLLVSSGAADGWLLMAVLPRLNELYERKTPVIGSGKLPEPHWEQEWKELHRASIQLNLAVLGSLLALLFLVVFARVV